MRLPLLLVALGLLSACDGQPAVAAPIETRPAADKARLFADARLVPTREGERIRHEIALAGEIVRALDQLPTVTLARANVELPRHASRFDRRPMSSQHELAQAGSRVTIVVATSSDTSELRSHAATIARGIVGDVADAALSIVITRDPAAVTPVPTWLVLLSSLGLGLCAGVIIERVRRPRR